MTRRTTHRVTSHCVTAGRCPRPRRGCNGPTADRAHRSEGTERGSVAVEMTLLTPLLLVMLLFVVYCGRVTGARLRIDDAAHQAARAAAAARTIPGAERDATSTAQAALAAAGVACQALQVTVEVAGLQPGSAVTATLTCTVGLNDLSLLSVGGSTTLTATSSSPVDIYRQAPGDTE